MHTLFIRIERVVVIYGSVTDYMGTAFTGLGVAHKYNELIQAATKTFFLKCPPTNSISDLLNKTGMHYIQRGYDIDKFMNPTQPDKTDAIFVKGPNLLFLQASHPVSLEPTDLGGGHRVLSFYDIYDEAKLREQNVEIVEKLSIAESALGKSLKVLSEAKKVHDDWEAINIKRMVWDRHEKLIETLKQELFGLISLNKKSVISHRLIGSLTSSGACDFIPSITKRLQRRMLIKGLPGTGKSTLMRALGKEGERRGFDVIYGWCGLDPEGIDLVLFPELSICLFDATKPHNYEVERRGDEIVDLVSMCEGQYDEIEMNNVQELYKKKILDATGYMQAYGQAENSVKLMMDLAIKHDVLEQKFKSLQREF